MGDDESEYDYEYEDIDDYDSDESTSSDDKTPPRRKKRRSRRQRKTPRRSRSPSPDAKEAGVEGDPTKMQLCSEHGNTLTPTSCNICKHLFHILRKDVRQTLVVDEPQSSVPTAKERLMSKRSDELIPSLIFSPEEMAIAEVLTSQGRFKQGHYEDIVHKHLFLPKDQNEALGKSLVTEDLFRPYEHDRKFQPIFRYKDQVVSVIKKLRMSNRPFVLAMSQATQLARLTRASGEVLGFTYPDKPTEIMLKGPTPVLDYLSPVESNFTPLPHIMDPTDGVHGLDEIQLSILKANHETNLTALQGFHGNIVNKVKTFYNGVKDVSLNLDNSLQFTSELLSHVDGSMAELARSKLLSIFKGRARGILPCDLTDRISEINIILGALA